ncbi:MAG: hypothetical protein JNJ48_06515 [Phycisphaerae bacterium]|nr:hypothetical protein [Phycisphaerae bacterium]
MTAPRDARSAFTLAEVIVGVVIVALIGGATTLVLSRSIKTRDTLAARHEAYQRAQAAVGLIARDLMNVARDNDLSQTRVRLSGGDQGELLLKAMGLRPVRPASQQNEGPVHEVQYRVAPGPDQNSTLWRRDDPFPDEYQDAGGVASPLVPGVVAIRVQAYDGNEWFDQWDTDADGYPHAVKVEVVASGGSGDFTATARQIVAIDRVPLPETQPSEDEQQPAQPTQPTTNPGGTNSGSGAAGGGATTGGANAGGGNGGRGAGRGPGGRPRPTGGGQPGTGQPGGGGGGIQPGGQPPAGTPATPRPGGGGGGGGGGQRPR